MAYDNTVPDPDNPGLEDVDAMRENFQLLEDSQVVDEGSTDDGDYIRYENGWQICWQSDFVSYHNDEQLRKTWSFPFNFISENPSVFSLVERDPDLTESGLDEWNMFSSFELSSSNVTFILGNKQDNFVSGDEQPISMLAIGRWE